MANDQTAGFSKYLIAAFRYKIFSPAGQRTTLTDTFNYLNYNLSYERIFYYARRVLPPFYRNSFPDTEEGNLQMAKTVLNKLDRRQDPELERYLNPATAPEEKAIIDQAIKESAATPTSGPTPAAVAAIHPPITRQLPSLTPKQSTEQIKEPAETITSRPLFQGFKIPSGITSATKNLGSSTSIGIRKGATGIGRNLSSMLGGLGQQSSGILGGVAKGGGKALLGGATTLDRFSNHFSTGRSLPGIPKKVWLGFVFILVLGVGVLSIFNPGQQTPAAAGGLESNLNSCQFTRSGNSIPIKSSILLGWINNTAAAAGIPASVLGSIAMHENPGFVTTKGDDAAEIQTGQYCVDGSPVCVDITKNEAKYQRACTSEEEQTGTLKTARAKGLMQLLDIYNEGFPFCDLKANIQRAAETLKGKMGSGSWSNEADIKKSVCGFFGAGGDSCKYPDKTGPYDYAAEVWQDYQNCQQIQQTLASQPSGCPTTGKITNPYGYNIAGYEDSNHKPYINELCNGLPYCHNGIDIGASVGTPVKSTMDGVVKGEGYDSFKGYYTRINNNASGFSIVYEHLQGLPTVALDTAIQKGQVVGKSGDSGETIGAHLHYRIEKNGVLVNPLRYIGQITNPSPYSQYLRMGDDGISLNNYTGAPIADVNDFGTCSSTPQ